MCERQSTPPQECSQMPSLPIFTAALWTYLENVDIPYRAWFSCEHCGELKDAPIIILDGTSTACDASDVTRCPPAPHDAANAEPVPDHMKRDRGTTKKDRLIVPDKRARDLLHRFTARTGALFTDLVCGYSCSMLRRKRLV